MKFDDFGTLSANQKLNEYIEKVLRPHFPNYSIASAISWGDHPTGIELTMSPFGEVLKASQFYYQSNQSDFVHFTNIHNARNIITEGCVYLSGLNTSTDKNEIKLNLRAFDDYTDSVNVIDCDVNQDFLNLSLSPFEESDSFLNKSFSNIQNNYSCFGGDMPIGIVFEIDLSNRDDWWCFHLSKVHYSEKDDIPPFFLQQIVKETKKWSTDFNFEINNLPLALFPLMAFFKEGKYKLESEVRLIKAPVDSTRNLLDLGPLFNGYSINSRNELVKIQKLYFEGSKKDKIFNAIANPNSRDNLLNSTPKIKLKKILLPTINFDSLNLKHAFDVILNDLGLDVEVSYIEFNNRNKSINIF